MAAPKKPDTRFSYYIRRRGRLRRVTSRRARNMLPQQRDSPEFRALMKQLITPMIHNRNFNKYSLEDAVRLIFGEGHRAIFVKVAVKDFVMPGLLLKGTVLTTPLLSDTKIPAGTPLLIRIDTRTENIIDIEDCEKDNLFRLGATEFSKIEEYIGEVGTCFPQKK